MAVASSKPPDIPSVDWWITSRCNLACDFCYGPAPGHDPIGRRSAILAALAASGAAAVTFCGGEPLLVREIDALASALAVAGKRTVLNTNGQLLRRRLSQGLELSFDIVGISVDGSTHEMHRAMRGPRADLAETLRAARLVRQQPGPLLKIATVVSSVNRDDLTCLASLVRELQPDVWRLYQYSRRGAQNSGHYRHHLPAGEFRRLAEVAAAAAAPVPVMASSENITAGCLIVDPEGEVLQPTETGYRRHGNCLAEPLEAIWARNTAPGTVSANKRWLALLLEG
jgi:MoaA/NifB/PqqE/SkfB family radical SAM enzyme